MTIHMSADDTDTDTDTTTGARERVVRAWRDRLARSEGEAVISSLSDDQVIEEMIARHLSGARTASLRFRNAAEFGVLYSHTSAAVWHDLVDGPYPDQATARRQMQAVLAVQGGSNGIQALLMGRGGALGDQWTSRSGHHALDLIRAFETSGKPLGCMPPR